MRKILPMRAGLIGHQIVSGNAGVSVSLAVTANGVLAATGSVSVSAAAQGSGSVGGGGGGFTPEAGFSVTSDFGDGNTLQIVDAQGRLGTRANAKPLYVFTHQTNRDPHPTWSRQTSGILQYDGTWISSGAAGITLPNNSAGAIRTDMTIFSNVSGPGLPFTGTKSLRVIKRYYGWNWKAGPATNIKASRLWPVSGANNFIVGYSLEGFTPKVYCEATDLFPTDSDVNFVPAVQTWLTDEQLFSASSANGVRDGKMHLFSNAKRLNSADASFITRDASNQSLQARHYLDQISNNQEPAGSYIWVAFDYFDDDWASVFWSDEPNYQNINNGTGTEYNREYCPPTAWATTGGVSTVNVVNRFGQNANLTGKYLYVRDGSGSVYKAGQKN